MDAGGLACGKRGTLGYNPLMPRICIIPRASNTGGVTSFQAKLSTGLAARGIQTCYDLAQWPYDAVLLTGAVRDLNGLRRARQKGARIVQRLDGINWLHRRLRTGPRHFLKAEYGNRLLAFLRSRFACRIVYQSRFVQDWWKDQFGSECVPSSVIYNGVDLAVFTPDGTHERPAQRYRLLLVEGSLQGGYEGGLETALGLAEHLAESMPVELVVAGRVSLEQQSSISRKSRLPIHWVGILPHEQIPVLDRSAHLLYSADLNAACPNSVIEALGCGLPVVAFATGAMPELVTGDSGRIMPYGGNPWTLDRPDIPALAKAAMEILREQDRFREAARQRAVEAFGLEKMVDGYLQVLLG
jgi:glycosyltransferase involved in cell wall biosynthesis